MNFSEIKDQVSSAYDAAKREAKRDCGGGVIQSRGKHLLATDKQGNVALGEAESIEWDGTKRQLEELIAECESRGLGSLSIEGGFNWAESVRALANDEYDPWVGEWSVEIWTA